MNMMKGCIFHFISRANLGSPTESVNCSLFKTETVTANFLRAVSWDTSSAIKAIPADQISIKHEYFRGEVSPSSYM
jgi:hypothetical protein